MLTQLEIRCETVGIWQENSYLLICGNDAILIDPGENYTCLNAAFSLAGEINIQAIFCTHGHFDHVGAVQEFKDALSIPFYIHSKDMRLLQQSNLYRRLAGDTHVCKVPTVDHFLDEMPQLRFGNLHLKIIYTPGHTQGSVSFEIGKNLISGDLIFQQDIGRSDLPGGSSVQLRETVKYILDRYRDYYIYPGHGKPFLLDESVINKLKSKL